MEFIIKLINMFLHFFMVSAIVERVSPPVYHGEGPVWDATNQKLYHVDISNQKIFRLDPSNGKVTSTYLNCGPVGVVVQVEGYSDKLLAGCGTDIVLVTWDGESDVANPAIKTLTSIDTDRNDTRVNDGKCDPAGRFWIGTMGLEIDGYIEPNRGSLYRISQNLDPKTILSPVSISNGLIWNKMNNTMYYIDSPTRKIVAFDYDNKSGNITNQRVVFELEKYNLEGVPDGMTIDEDDNLWIALYDGSSVIQVDPKNGTLLQQVQMPVDKITSVAFGGPNFDILYVTTSSVGLTEEQKNLKPDSGSVFAVTNLNIRGRPADKFRLND